MIARGHADVRKRARSYREHDSALSVSEVLRRVHGVLEANAGELIIRDELAEWKTYPSGHCYGALRDGRSQLSLIMHRREATQLLTHLEVGSDLLVFGSLAVYAGQGKLQCVVHDIRLGDGRGLEAVARDRLLRSLREEGHLDPTRKRALPPFPRAVGLVTSVGSAALGDIVAGLNARAPWVRLVVAHANLSIPDSIASAVDDLANSDLVSVILVARGGGSAVDLSPFDSAAVAHAIAACPIPVVSAVGHDLHVTIADLVADKRAATPSAACAVVVPDGAALRARLAGLRGAGRDALARQVAARAANVEGTRQRMRFALQSHLSVAAERARRTDLPRVASALSLLTSQAAAKLDHIRTSASGRDLLRLLGRRAQSLITLVSRSVRLSDLAARDARITALRERLSAYSPQHALARGSAFVETIEGRPVRTTSEVRPDSELRIHMRDGTLLVRVTAVLQEASDDR
jgi:exodeoxyribonuclease VII large subunit